MKKKVLILSITILLLITGFFVYYINDYYRAKDMESYLESSDDVNVSKIENGYMFDGPGSNTALIFYPGAKVETKAYAKLMNKFAKEGIDCFLLDMPCRLAFFGKNRATKILNSYNYDKWLIAGHSLGGVVASQYVNNSPKKIDTLILLASYPTQKINNDIKLVSIYGQKDGVLNKKAYDDSQKYFPLNNYEKEIDGGNHANFANYGEQKSDNIASISDDEEQIQTVLFVKECLRKN